MSWLDNHVPVLSKIAGYIRELSMTLISKLVSSLFVYQTCLVPTPEKFFF